MGSECLATPVVLPTLLLYFYSSLLLTFLPTSFANASFNTSLLRSKRSAPSETLLNPDTARVGVSLCSLSRSDRIATRASCSGTEGLNVCSRDSLPMHSTSLNWHWWWWQRVSLCRWPCLMFYPPDLARSEYTFGSLHEALGTVVSDSHAPNLYLGFIVTPGQNAPRMFHQPRQKSGSLLGVLPVCTSPHGT